MPDPLRRPANFVLLAILLSATLYGFLTIPASLDLPVRWGASGEVTGSLPRNWALLQMPIATGLLWGLVYLIATSGTATKRPSTAIVLRWVIPVVTALLAAVQIMIVLIGTGHQVPFFQSTFA